MKAVAVIGATGYTGGELLRYLLSHPDAEIVHCTSESSAGKAVSSIHSDLLGRTGLVLEKCDEEKIAGNTELAFLCLPHGHSARTGKKFLDLGVKVVDLSADFRLRSGALYKKWYGAPHPYPALLKKAVYGLPETRRARIAEADLVANPGCYSTATLLSTLPLSAKRLAREGSVIVDAKSGVSGAGKKLDARYLFCEDNENFLAYAVGGHRHSPEVEQELGMDVTFVPHLLPITRGILVTVYAGLKKKMTANALRDIYLEYYKDERFVTILPEGSFPDLKSVQHSNFCRIGIGMDEKNSRAIVVGAIDNLGKGAAGQAVQNMNLMFGMDEGTGLL